MGGLRPPIIVTCDERKISDKKAKKYLTCHNNNTTMFTMKNKQKNEPAEMKFLQVRMNSDLVDKAKERAQKSGLTLSLVVRRLIEDYVSDPQPKLIFG